MYKLLIIDDEPIIRKGITSLIDFEKLNIGSVYEAANGNEGLEIFKSQDPDMILLDINMPKINGLELSEQIKTINPDVKIAIITGYDYFDYAQKALKIGVDDYILKPVSKSDIVEILVKMIQKLEVDHINKAIENTIGDLIEHKSVSDSGIKNKIKTVLNDSLDNPNLSLTSVSQELGYSSSYMSTLFKKEFGVSFQDYVLDLRLSKAKIILLSENLKVYEVANLVGFEDVNYFSTRFKRKYGHSPSVYKSKVGDLDDEG